MNQLLPVMADSTQVSGSSREPAQPRAEHPRSGAMTVRLIEAKELPQYEEAWWKLSNTAVVPNVFYEPWMLLPALEPPTDLATLRFLLVFGPTGKDGTEPLWGFFPLELQTKSMKLPVKALAFWQHHRYFYLTVPLIDAGHAAKVLDAFWRWFEGNPLGCRILDTNQVIAEGPFHAVWADFAIGRTSFTVIDFPRAFLQPASTAESYISDTISKKHRDEFLRCERRLSELGKLEYRQVDNLGDVDTWLDEFLRLEAAGWKGGPDGRAFAKETEHTEYLRTITREGFLRNRVMLLSLTLDGKPIAMKHNILSGEGGFSIKIAYDEEFAKYSPGVLLELENIRRVCNDSRIKWVDSCASPRHVMANRVWRERLMIRRTLFSNNSHLGDFWISVLPLLRWIKKQVTNEEVPAQFRISTKG
jgi:hypothetical protein